MRRAHVLAVAIAALGGCAQVPERPAATVPAVAPKADPALARAIAEERVKAQQRERTGDLARAEEHWQVVTLLDPADADARRALADVRAAIGRVRQEQSAAAQAAMRAGDLDRAAKAYLHVLAADPNDADAAKGLREIDRQRIAKVQADRAAAVARAAGTPPATASAANGSPTRLAEPVDGYDLEQRLEMFRAGDATGGLRELRRFVEAHPNDRAARAQIGAAVYERGRELEAQGAREDAVVLYEQALLLRGENDPEWNARLDALRRSLATEYFGKAEQAATRDPASAVRFYEASLRYDPRNVRAQARLMELRKTAPPRGKPKS